ncbi:MAG: hypothetical protein KIS78_02840 [Labilithrix sp.]|nr:hypothetical protein [Labilithrix sp.]
MATSTCPACGADAFVADAGTGTAAEGGQCSRCGYTSGESSRCPHCNAVARIEGSGLAAVCAMCGGPRLPSNLGGDSARGALREQKKALANARAASVATVLQGAFSTVATLIGLAILPASILGKLVVFAIALVPLLLAMRSRGRARAARESAAHAAERAWQAAAEDVATRRKGGVTAAELAATLGIEAAHADKLLTALTVNDRTRIDVGDDAEVRYSVGADRRVRVGEGPPADEELADETATAERESPVR